VEDRWTEILPLASTSVYWTNKGDVPELTAKRRSALCALLSQTDEVLNAINADLVWTKLARRLKSLLALCEEFGLFVLRRGTIETYYIKADGNASIGKPEAAAEEAIHLQIASKEDAELAYQDIVRCIRYAARAESINEAEALRDLILAVVAPAHARFRNGNVSMDFNVLSRQTIGDKSKILDLTVEGNLLKVSVKSNVIDAAGFPIYLTKDQDPIDEITQAAAGMGVSIGT
jgi:hypothetical protein